MIVFEKEKSGKTNKNITHSEEQSTEAAIMLFVSCCSNLIVFTKGILDFSFYHSINQKILPTDCILRYISRIKSAYQPGK